jgi:hypothetical protein
MIWPVPPVLCLGQKTARKPKRQGEMPFVTVDRKIWLKNQITQPEPGGWLSATWCGLFLMLPLPIWANSTRRSSCTAQPLVLQSVFGQLVGQNGCGLRRQSGSNPPLTCCSTLRASERQLFLLSNAYFVPIPAIQLSPDRPLSQTPVLRFECYKAAGGDLTHPAQSVSKQVEEAVPLSRISTNQIFIGGIAA